MSRKDPTRRAMEDALRDHLPVWLFGPRGVVRGGPHVFRVEPWWATFELFARGGRFFLRLTWGDTGRAYESRVGTRRVIRITEVRS